MSLLHRSATWIAAAFVFTAMASQATASNILVNPGFQTEVLGPWFQVGEFSPGEDWNVSTVLPHTGFFAATDVGNKELRQNFAPTASTSITEVSFYAAHPDFIDPDLAVGFYYSDASYEEFVVQLVGTEYNFFNVTSFLNLSKTLTGISMYGNTTGRTYIDDVLINVNVSAVPEPSKLTLGLFGFGLMAYRRRRSAR